MRRLSLILVFGIFSLCHLQAQELDIKKLQHDLEQTSIRYLKQHLYTLASDSMEGRNTAQAGQKKAARYLVSQLESYGLKQIATDSNGQKTWYQPYPFVKRFGDRREYEPYADNVIAWLPAKQVSNEFVVISAHYDHLGIRRDTIYNGADDNGSGTSSVLEIARLMAQGGGLNKHVLFIFFSGEEKGLLGSDYFVNHPVVPIKDIYVDLNIDMVGRADEEHAADSHYVYVIGSDKISKRLDSFLVATNNMTERLDLDYTYNAEDDPLKLYYRSDHYNFAERGIPVAFFFSGLHPDYHKHTDDVEKINFEVLYHRMNLVYQLAIQLATTDQELSKDK